MSDASHISTTALAKKYNLTAKDLFNQLQQLELITRNNDKWQLTDKGIATGGLYKESKQYGKYIVWPQDLHINSEKNDTEHLLNATEIGKHFNLSAIKINFMLAELGWINKQIKGWTITQQGKKQGGIQAESQRTGIPFTKWPSIILESTMLNDSVQHILGNKTNNKQDNEDMLGFRDKFPAKHRTADGHLVRSKAEMIIDNWLYMAEIVHAYERKLPIEEAVYCDFYIPAGKVYIEYWGYENDQKYAARKKIKQEIYKKYDFNLIELDDNDVLLLDDILPKHLLKYNVSAY